MNTKQKRLFETDRRMELKLRLMAKRAGTEELADTGPLALNIPERELVRRLIERVRQL